MKNNIEISVIIPVYNMESFLTKCLVSLLTQTFRNFEIICINDGSTDNSLNILNSFSNMDDRINIINQKNQGVSIARNIGISKAKGDYVIFVDSDDFLEKTMIEELYKKIISINGDIVFCDYMLYTEQQQFSNNLRREFLQHTEFCWKTFKNDLNPILINMSTVVPWGKIIRKDLLLNHKFFFPENMLFEDNYVGIMTFLYAEKIAVVNKPLYYYRIDNPKSLSGKSGKYRSTLDLIKISNLLVQSTEKKFKKNKFINKLLLNWIVSNNLSWFLVSKIKREYHASFYQFMHQIIQNPRFSDFISDNRIQQILNANTPISLYYIATFRKIQRKYRTFKRRLLSFFK